MKNNWKWFLLIESLLIIVTLYQLINNLFILGLFAIGCWLIFLGRKQQERRKKTNLAIGLLLTAFALMSLGGFWYMSIAAVIFFYMNYGKVFSKMDTFNFQQAPWNEKEIVVVETTDSLPKNAKRFKRNWLGNERIGSSIYEWDDINFSIFMGDTIIDLGNTLLPKEESYILIRKGFGKTRILVPTGIGVMIEHSSVKGKVLFEGQCYMLENESIKMYSKQYESQARTIKIITSVIVGDLEVITI
ncbi:cell wall-active antibiotics response protein LiaF [Carnobacterium pleistocenium]|uniref:cell wall-active antibiotics response protein LiaF n=1 Tax=Carnobacterium pleistocenium TaxID=181073 RepID=UPI000556A3F1|nr:cell wall-active antibiotics response protein LiaF [Carnobacterium pleistocenium]